MSGDSRISAEALHAAGDRAAYDGDLRSADAYRLLEGNERAAQVIRVWMYEHLSATDEEIRGMAQHLALGWGASSDRLYQEALDVLYVAGKPA